jgi:glycosyltransferase involved in cell wall biosynthesis
LLGAAAVICVSESAADQAVRYLDLPADRLHVVPHGVDPIFTPTGARQVEADPYLLWVSAWGPHKGLDDALAVVAQLAAAGQPHRLVIVGPSDEWMRRQVDLAIVRSPRPDLARVAGYVEDLPAFYRGAAALMVTSRAEGFGLPALEAMACGTPVVAYANTSLPELVGDAGVLVDDGDLAGFAAAVADLLTDDAAQADLRAAGPHRAAAYTWARSVAAHIEIYRSISSAV